MRIIVRTIFEDKHWWPSAPQEVGFLRNMHRHLFYVEVSCEVTHDDRELEFFMVKKVLDGIIRNQILLLPVSKSCEQMGLVIKKELKGKYDREFVVRIFEDNENGVEV